LEVALLAAMDDGRGSLHQIKYRPHSPQGYTLDNGVIEEGSNGKGQR
jgi:hypothetical protein